MKFFWRIVDLIVGGIFVFAGVTKILDLDHIIGDLGHLQFSQLIADIKQLRFANPMGFANDIDNYKTLPWFASVRLAFYLPWLEIFCGLALVFRFLYRGGLSIL